MRTATPGARGRRTWPQRLLLSLNVFLVIAALSTAAALGVGYEKAGYLPRMYLDGVLEPATADASGNAQPLNILLVGTDSSAGLDPDDPVMQGRQPSQLADVIMILRLEPGSGDAALLSIPRDLWVPIAGTSRSSKINATYLEGGAPALIETIDEYLGIPINHFVQVDFAGFRDVVAAIGDVEVYFPHPARDRRSHLDVPEAGCVSLDPDQALAFARSRYFEVYVDGRWEQDPTADWGRMRRQQDFMRLALSQAIDQGIRNPATANALVNAVSGAVIFDEGLTTGMILDIANAFRMFSPESLGGYTLQGLTDPEMKGGQLAEVLRMGEAQPILALFQGTEGLDPTPESVWVRVVNGTGLRNQAGEVADDLRLVGFSVRSTDNSPTDLVRTEVRYAPGQRAGAELLARHLATAPVLVEDPDLRLAPVELATGSDYTGVLAEPRDPAPASSPTTSDPPTSPTNPTDPAGDDEPEASEPAPDSTPEAPRAC
ncbi:LCP family protein [Actinomarinicola tropica]|uniref:LytR family transcriptional regulator n=1 Tax=Actinomarinicola tropica TaxID=2789776 RepID=A0A5Q2RG83_9ACTN|nr:LCP family protein [Actinomarinicola tropica]QGG95829.1 hypothetical protein GH723_12370 [Actinomarinicola tropica]